MSCVAPNRPRPGQQRGITLLEVLVSILIFSFGILGLVALQARATQYSVDAEDRNRAALLADDMAAQMYAIRSVNVSNAQIDAWKLRVADATGQGVPGGEGEVDINVDQATVTVRWKSPRASEPSQISTVVIP